MYRTIRKAAAELKQFRRIKGKLTLKLNVSTRLSKSPNLFPTAAPKLWETF